MRSHLFALPLLPRLEALEPRQLLSLTPGAAVGAQPVGALTGRIVYTVGGHGFTAASNGTWSTQRGLTNGMVEDMGNQDQFTAYIQHLFHAGATIVPLRPVGYQPNEIVIDNPAASFTGSWSNGSSTPYFSLNNGDDAVRYKFATGSLSETAVARYTPNIPTGGFYPVYAWALDGSNRVSDQLYRVVHSGGATEVKVNHQRVGKGWVYLGTYHFNAGTGGYVEISNKTSTGGGAIIADAIRFGNGMGDINRGAGVSGQSREDELNLYWIEKQLGWISAGVREDESVYRGPTNDGDSSDGVSSPPRYAAYMNNAGNGVMTDRVFLSFHSNAATGSARGTIGLYNGNNDPATKTPNQQQWAYLVAKETNDDLVALSSQLEHPWYNRTTMSSLTLDRTDIEFGEINNLAIGDEFDATILEVAFHDNVQDAQLMRDPKVRWWVGRASMQATVRYFNQFGGGTLNLMPDAPTNVRALVNPSGDVTISWAAPVADGVGGDSPTGYRIYCSLNGYGFDGGIAVSGGSTTTYTIPAAMLGADAYYFRVAAFNAGGESLPSEVVGARKNPFGKNTILVVNGFDRLERTQNPRQTTRLSSGGSLVTFDRVRPRFSNSFDYVVQAGEAIEAYSTPIGFDSCQNDAIINGQVNLLNYDTVIWLSGEESVANKTFDPAEQSLVAGFVSSGGHLFVSGSEIGYELVGQGAGASFYNGTLKATYVADSAGTYNASGVAGTIFAGISLSFDNGSQFYDVDYPDVLSTSGGSSIAMSYVGGTGGGAAVQWSGAGGARVVNMGFPFETITTAANRNAVMAAVLSFFGVGDPAATPSAPDLAEISDTGISSTDDLTRLNNSPGNTLQFTIGGVTSGATITLYADGASTIGGGVASGSSITITTNGSVLLADGLRNITAVQSISGRPPSAASAPLAITVDTVAPVVSISVFAYETSQALAFGFSEPVGATLAVPDLTLQNITTSQTIAGGLIALSYNTGTNVGTFTFPGLPNSTLPNGNYQATLAAAGINDNAGNPLAVNHLFSFFVLAGDANRDRTVDITDLGILATNWQQSPRTFSQGDFNYDSTVDITDLGILATNWQQNLPIPSAPAAQQRAPFGARRAAAKERAISIIT